MTKDLIDDTEIENNHNNKIPLFIKLAWMILLIWAISYLLIYALPDFMEWMRK
ncbi:MAG: hypothetical protein OXB88_02675 [Bacteriovoracales bacterium]|nr:hypothetical protein [Bacteriovoracales bacterium]